MAVSDQTNSLHVTNIKPDNFVVDVTRISHNSKQKLQRSLSRKINPTNDNQRDSKINCSASPASLGGANIILEKQNVDLVGQSQPHYQISINTTVKGGGGGAESRCPIRGPSLRRSQTSWGFDPRKMLVLLASLSSMGTILLIYFTLSVSNPSGDDIAQS